MEQNDFIQIIDVQSMDTYTRPILNVYHYRIFTMTDEGTPLQVVREDIASAFAGTVMDFVRGIQSQSISHNSIRMINLSNNVEIADFVWGSSQRGQAAATAETAQLTFSFKLTRYDRVVRNGSKRLAGVDKLFITNNNTLLPQSRPLVNAVEIAFKSPINVEFNAGGGMTLIPVILRKPLNPGVPPTVFSTVLDAEFRGFGTQNTRKSLNGS